MLSFGMSCLWMRVLNYALSGFSWSEKITSSFGAMHLCIACINIESDLNQSQRSECSCHQLPVKISEWIALLKRTERPIMNL